MKTFKEKFEEKFNKTDSCWLWKGALCSGGYGSLSVKGKVKTASRVAYELFVGEIPVGLKVLHKCDVRKCVNPEHLFLGTDQDNVNDMLSKKRDKGITTINRLKTHCVHGHELTEENTRYYYFHGTKHRGCKKCSATRDKIKKLARRRFLPNTEKTHCIHGHEFNEINTRFIDGRRMCKECARIRGRISDKKRRQKKHELATHIL